MKKSRRFIFLAILIGAAATAGFIFLREKPPLNTIRMSGNVEITDVQLGFKITGRLAQCLVDEGDKVAKGDVLARLENEDQSIALALSQASLARAEAMLAELMAGSRPEEIESARAQVLQARQVVLELTRGSRPQEIQSAASDVENALAAVKSARARFSQAKADYDRFSALYDQKGTSPQEFKRYQTQYEVARNEVTQAESRADAARQALSLGKEGPRQEQIEQAKAALAQAEAQYALVKQGPRKETIQQAKAQVNEAQQRVNQARQQLSYTELFAPMDGVILVRSAEPGEYLNPSTPVVTLGDLDHPWLRAFITETDLGRIRLNDKADVFTDAFPDTPFGGRVTFISSQAEFTPKSVQTFEERVKLMFRIKIALSNPRGQLKPGMPADAVITPIAPAVN